MEVSGRRVFIPSRGALGLALGVDWCWCSGDICGECGENDEIKRINNFGRFGPPDRAHNHIHPSYDPMVNRERAAHMSSHVLICQRRVQGIR